MRSTPDGQSAQFIDFVPLMGTGMLVTTTGTDEKEDQTPASRALPDPAEE